MKTTSMLKTLPLQMQVQLFPHCAILSREIYPYVASKIPEMDTECKCPSIDALKICNFCRQVRYLLNFRVFKFCLKRIPESFQDHIVTTYQYFKRMPGCPPFFKYSKEHGKIGIYLDSPREPYYIKKTDC